MQWRLRNGKQVDVDPKTKSKCRSCEADIYWGKVGTTRKLLPLDLLFNDQDVLSGVKLHFSTCPIMKKKKQAKLENCPSCGFSEKFDYQVKLDKTNKIYILQICAKCSRKIHVPTTKENFKLAAQNKPKSEGEKAIEEWQGKPKTVDFN